MADEALFEFLHMELVALIHRSAEKDEKDGCIAKLESLGFRVGQSLIERFTRDCSRFKDELDTMKFICKDFWNSVYKKQIDNLRTNHQGVYVLQDNKFRFLTQMSNGKQYMEAAPKFLAFPCGLIRGALSSLGINCIVTAEVSAMPAFLTLSLLKAYGPPFISAFYRLVAEKGLAQNLKDSVFDELGTWFGTKLISTIFEIPWSDKSPHIVDWQWRDSNIQTTGHVLFG